MAKPKEPIETDAMEAWLRAELEGGLLSYVTIDTQSWARDLAGRVRAGGFKLSDGAYRALRKRVEDHAAARLSLLHEDAQARAYQVEADDALRSAVSGPEADAVRAMLSEESGRLVKELQQAAANWGKRVLGRVKTEMPELTMAGHTAVTAIAATRAALCFRWASEARKWGERQAESAGVVRNGADKKTGAT